MRANGASLPAAVADRLERLVEPSQGWRGALGDIKAGGRQPGLETPLAEVRRLETVRAIGLPADLFGGVPDAQLAAWRARAGAEFRRTCAAIRNRCG